MGHMLRVPEDDTGECIVRVDQPADPGQEDPQNKPPLT